MRPIKFRGRDFNGQFVFGDLIHLDFKYLPVVHLFIVDHNGEHEVTPETVAQLVGYDRNNYEVYEGDILIDDLEQEHIAEIYDRPAFLSRLELKA